MDGGAWWAAVHGIAKSWTRLSDFTFTFHFHALEKEMASDSSIFAWRIPGTGGAWRATIYGVTLALFKFGSAIFIYKISVAVNGNNNNHYTRVYC